MTVILRYWKPIALFAFLALYGGFMWNTGAKGAKRACEGDKAVAEARHLREYAEVLEAVRDKERDSAERINRLAEAYETDKRNAQESADRLVADLRAGTVRLQNRWAGCQATASVSSAAASAAELDAEAADRAASASRIVQAARDADDQIRRLQQVVEADRK